MLSDDTMFPVILLGAIGLLLFLWLALKPRRRCPKCKEAMSCSGEWAGFAMYHCDRCNTWLDVPYYED